MNNKTLATVQVGDVLTDGHKRNTVSQVWRHSKAPGMNSYGRAGTGKIWLVMSSGATWVFDDMDVVTVW